ncbi:adenylate kinase family protein [Halorhabdus sp. BNX81]|uniref:adenylate kinase family protein n=1 Tax=Halorhabdus sp. BNX81 TaxID=2980181 RepID=UPI0023DD4275|nr:adenylate kinase family protein [Halorhabdus sp. BNX81]WEL21264.1 Adenylate kinase [Halorhabdus sp. BNX81]
MRVAVTGTPGTGKTTATEQVDALDVIHLNQVIDREGFIQGVDDERGSSIADLDAIESWLDGRDDILIESHLAHHVPVDRVIVLRCHPETIEQRLRERGESPESAQENAESEALDVVLTEAVDAHGPNSVYEIETTERLPETVADEIEAVIAGDREPNPGVVSYIEYL